MRYGIWKEDRDEDGVFWLVRRLSDSETIDEAPEIGEASAIADDLNERWERCFAAALTGAVLSDWGETVLVGRAERIAYLAAEAS